jgi:hypothetical protein
MVKTIKLKTYERNLSVLNSLTCSFVKVSHQMSDDLELLCASEGTASC